MAQYTPKSKVKISHTSGKEFVELSTNIPYQGMYLEYSNGKFFSGNNPQTPGGEIIRKKQTIPNFRPSVNNYQYKNLQKRIHTNLTKKKPIPNSKTKPTSKDHDRGYFTRYFCKRANSQFDYIEINKKTYDALASQDPKYDFNLYQIGNIKWALSETPNHTVSQINRKNITQKANIYPFLIILFDDLSEYKTSFVGKMSSAIRKSSTLTKELKERRTKEQKEERQKEIASVTQEEINQSIKDLESGKTPYIYNPGF